MSKPINPVVDVSDCRLFVPHRLDIHKLDGDSPFTDGVCSSINYARRSQIRHGYVLGTDPCDGVGSGWLFGYTTIEPPADGNGFGDGEGPYADWDWE